MELAFITSALRRYAWIVASTIAVTTLAGILLSSGGPTLYRSEAILLVIQPTESQLTVSVGGDVADRYVAGQLSVLRSQVMAERVAEELGGGTTRLEVHAAITIAHEPGTDVVTVAADTADPERSQELASTYVDVYFASMRSQLERTVEPLVDSVEAQIVELREEIAEVDDAMVAAMRPYLTSDPVPSLEQVVPGLVSEKSLLLGRLQQLQTSSAQLQLGPRVASEIVQQATLPSDPVPSDRAQLLPVFVLGGGLAGVLLAVVLARFSPNVLTDEQAEEILGVSVVGRIPEASGGSERPRPILDPLPPPVRQSVESVCVRAGSANPSGTPVLSIVVVGSRPGAGATTLASAMAQYFAENGSRVFLIDGDHAAPELTSSFVEGHDLVPVDGALPVALESRGKRGKEVGPTSVAQTRLPSLYVGSIVTGAWTADLAGGADATVTQNLDVYGLLLHLGPVADVVIFDGGPLMGSISTVQLVHHCDAVVLAMPRRQSIRGLEQVATELDDRRVLPVWTPARRRRRRRGTTRGPAAQIDEAEAADAVS